MDGSGIFDKMNPARAGRIKKLQQDINDLCGGDAIIKTSPAGPADVQEFGDF